MAKATINGIINDFFRYFKTLGMYLVQRECRPITPSADNKKVFDEFIPILFIKSEICSEKTICKPVYVNPNKRVRIIAFFKFNL